MFILRGDSMTFEAYSPAHITGFFEICDENPDTLHVGSRGAGVSIERGVLTCVKVGRTTANHCEIRINGRRVEQAPVSDAVVKRYLELAGHQPSIQVDHLVNVPIGAGFGSSGAAALSLSLSLNKALEVGLSTLEAAQIAHEVEVECKTGLGTVIAELEGGFEIRTEPGAPGVGRVERIPLNGGYRVVCLSLSGISTKTTLTDGEARDRINSKGRAMVDQLVRTPSIHNFLRLSNRFTLKIDFMTGKLRRYISKLTREGYTAGMMMIGEGLFTVVRENEVRDVVNIFNSNGDRGFLAVSKIDMEGAHLL